MPMLTHVCIFIGMIAAGGSASADVAGVSADGMAGYGRVVSPVPSPDITARFAYAADYASADSLLYARDRTTNVGHYASLALTPWRHLDMSLQYRALDTRNSYVRPSVLRVRGDLLFGAKLSQRFGAYSLGILGQARHYVGEDTPAFGGHLLAGYESGSWLFAVQPGFVGERPVSWERGPSVAERFAWRKPAWNAATMRLALAHRFPQWTPFVDLSNETYLGAGGAWQRQPKRAALGAHVATGLPGVTATPRFEAALGRGEGPGIPAEPPWRAGMALSYEPPLRAIVNALFPPPGSFAAVVTNVAYGYPVPNLQARINGRELSQKQEGVYLFEGAAGNYVLTLDAAGYIPVTAAVRVEPAQYKVERFGMRRNAGVVRGFVFLGENDRGLATIKLQMPELEFQTDPATGAFSFELPPDAYAITVTAPGFLPEKRTFVLKVGKEVVFDRLVLKRAPVQRGPAPAAQVAAPATTPTVAAAPPTAPVSAPPAPVVTPPPPVTKAAPPSAPPAPAPEQPARVRAIIVDEEQELERRRWPPAGDLPERIESPVFFAFNSWSIDPRSYPALDRLAEMIKGDPSIERVVIEGRADVVGSAEANRFVAGKRADAIFEYLAARGVEHERLATTTTTYKRRATGQSETQRAQDRRVGFRIEREE